MDPVPLIVPAFSRIDAILAPYRDNRDEQEGNQRALSEHVKAQREAYEINEIKRLDDERDRKGDQRPQRERQRGEPARAP